MTLTVTRRATLLRSFVVVPFILALNTAGAWTAEARTSDRRSGERKAARCGLKTRERIRAVMDGTPTPPPDGRPPASNRTCE